MISLKIRPLARSDIKKIWYYSYKNWGKEQADKYTLDLGKGMENLVSNPEKGRLIDGIKNDYRLLTILEHCVVYRFASTEIDVVRVLGKRMDIKRHL